MFLLVVGYRFIRRLSKKYRIPWHCLCRCQWQSGEIFAKLSNTKFHEKSSLEAAFVHRRPDKPDELIGRGGYSQRTGKFLNMPEASRVLTVCVHFLICQYSVAMFCSQNPLCKKTLKPCHCTERRGAWQQPQNINSNFTLILCCLKFYRHITWNSPLFYLQWNLWLLCHYNVTRFSLDLLHLSTLMHNSFIH